jgi:stage IV sporulation protein FB
MLLFIAIFVYVAAAGEAQDSALRSAVTGLRVMDAMETRVASMPVEASLGDAVDVLLATAQHQFPVLDGHRKPVGLLVREDLIAALGARPPDAPLADIMRAPVTLVRAGQDLGEAMTLLGGGGTPALCVVDEAGALAGLLTRETLAEMMMIKSVQPDWTFKRRW